MRLTRIYTPQHLTLKQKLALEAGASRHIAKVLRMRAGRELVVFNGQGGEYRAQITAAGNNAVEVILTDFSAVDRESPLAITLGIGISRGDRMDWVIQKAVETGVAAIAPLFTERTEVRLAAERLQKKHRHWQQVMISACEQCGRNRLPQIAQPQLLQPWLQQAAADKKFVLHHKAGRHPLDAGAEPASVALLIGPEGGLAGPEIDAAEGHGFEALALGPRVLRTETAPLVAIGILQQLWGDIP